MSTSPEVAPNTSIVAAANRQFMSGGGDMGELMRAKDWASTPLGEPQTWPQSLRTMVRLILSTNHPIGVFWGNEHIFLYNDAYSASLGPEKHPSLLGARGQAGWAEIWSVIEPQITLVMTAQGATWHEDHLVPITRNGVWEDVYWTYSYSPIDEASAPNGIGGVLVICNETTSRVLAEKRAAFKLQLETALRDLTEPATVVTVGSTLLGNLLKASSVGYSEIDASGEYAEPFRDWVREGGSGLSGKQRLADYGPGIIAELRAGRTIHVGSVDSHSLTAKRDLQSAYIAINTNSFISVPLLRQGQLAGMLYVLSERSRNWTVNEVAMVEDVAKRIWASFERARTLNALRESDARFQAIANSISEMVWSTNADGQQDYSNDRWYDFTGLALGSIANVVWHDILHPEDQPIAKNAWQASLASGEAFQAEYRLKHHSGVYRWMLCRAQAVRDDAGRITRWYGTCTDIQEIFDAREILARSREDLEKLIVERTAALMASEAQLRQSQKMEAIGQLTGGIAHDFNNMLAVVLGSLALLKRSLAKDENGNRIASDDGRVHRHLEAAVDGAKRAGVLTKRLLAFARQQPLTPELIDANRLIEGMDDIFSPMLGGEFIIKKMLAPELWPIHIDPNQLENVILNLAVNARDAMPNGGVLTIKTHNVILDTGFTAGYPSVAKGEYVVISVADEGIGMPPEVIAKSFEPFFTTKEVGKGTGLGLSQAYGFVKQSGGEVTIDSEVGSGTTVSLYLPRALQDQAIASTISSPVVEAIKSSEVPLGTRQQVVLVVEDDPAVRQFAVEAVDVLGYTAFEASSATNAQQVLQLHPEIDILLTDIVMPEITGRSLAKLALFHNPKLKVIFMTGYAKTRLLENDVHDIATTILWKPFTIEELGLKLHQALNVSGASAHNP